MRLHTSIFCAGLALSACATEPLGPESAGQVNASMEQRIEQRVAEGRADGFPDIKDSKGTAPQKPDLAAIAAQRAAIEKTGLITAAEIEALKDGSASDALKDKAAALLVALEKDRAKAKAEGSLADRANELR